MSGFALEEMEMTSFSSREGSQQPLLFLCKAQTWNFVQCGKCGNKGNETADDCERSRSTIRASSSCDPAGVCSADQRAEPLPGAAAGARGGDRRAEGWAQQHTSQYPALLLALCEQSAGTQWPETNMPPAAPGTSGMPGVPSWAEPQDDRGEEAGPVSRWGFQRGGGPESSEVLVWAPQSSGREGAGKATSGPGARVGLRRRAAHFLTRGKFLLNKRVRQNRSWNLQWSFSFIFRL